MSALLKQPKIRFSGFSGDWQVNLIGSIFKITSGTTPLRSNLLYFQYGIVNWVKTTDLNNSLIFTTEEKISKIALNETSLRVLPSNTIFVAMYGGFNQIGRTGLLTMRATCNQALAAILPEKDFSSFFLLTYLNYHVNDWKDVAASSRKDPNITKDNVANFSFNYPNLTEQTTIGNFFRQLDEALSLAEQKRVKTEQIKKAMLGKMFPKAGSNQPEIRLKGFSGDWTETKFKEIGEFNPKAELPQIFQYIDLESVVGTKIISQRKEFKETAPSRAQRLAKKGDLFFQAVRPYQKNNHLFENDDSNFVFSTGYIQIRPYIDGYFLLTIIQLESFLQEVLLRCTGTSYPAINTSGLQDIIFKLPKNLDEQIAIGEFFRQLDDTLALQAEHIKGLKRLKTALLSKMFV